MAEAFAEMLSGGHHNSLGRTEEVVGIVVAGESRLDELFRCLDVDDELVRLRAGDALEKVCRERPAWFVARADRVLGEMAAVNQPSVQWHVAQILEHTRDELTGPQKRRALALVKRQLTDSSDWIVLNTAMAVLAGWTATSDGLAGWLEPELRRLAQDDRKAVAKRATKLLDGLTA